MIGTPLSLANNSAELKALFAGESRQGSAPDRINLDDQDGKGFLEFIELSPDFNLIVSRCRWDHDRQIGYRGEGWLRMNCCLDASAAMEFSGKDRYDLFGAECRIFHQPEGTDCTHFIRGNANSLCVTISAKRAYLVDELVLDPAELPGAVGQFLEGRHDDFFFERFTLKPDMARTVLDMVRNTLDGRTRALYMAAKAHELVCQSWDLVLDKDGGSRAPLSLTRSQLGRVELARNILDSSLDVTPGAAQLARQVGLNRNQLSYGFRALFDMTVYDYHLARRLEAAWEMLAVGEKQIAEIALTVGYRHQTSFATAFRAHFGVSPKDVARGSRSATRLANSQL
jgi:AraC-like DNA-binding protein